MKKRIMVYTCITGNYDQITPITVHDNSVDYYCFTNNRKIKSKDWKVIYVNNDGLCDKMLSKKYKILGDSKLESNYDIVMYLDGNIQLEKPVSQLLKEHCDFSKYSLFFLAHHERNCTYQEKEECIRLNLDNPRLIQNQLRIYEKEGFPKEYGLICCGLIVRKSGDNRISKMLKHWYEQVEKYSKRDQLSVMYSIWKKKINYGKIKLEFYNNAYFTVHPHTREKLKRQPCAFGSGITNELGQKEEQNKYEPEKDSYHCNIEDLNDSHSSIARKVKKGSTVLDIGCGVGIIGRLLFENKQCINYGIEIDPEACQRANESGYYKNVYNFSIEEEKELQAVFKNEILFDYIILADVLEHMKEPCETLYKLTKLLKEEGKVLISIPNVAYMDIIRALINRQFNYQKTGILDSTHFRFFTKQSFIEMIDNFNDRYDVSFDIEWFDATKVDPIYEERSLKSLLNLDGQGTVVQNIFELTKLSRGKNPEKLISALQENSQDNFKAIEEKISEYERNKEELEVLKTQYEELKRLNDELQKEKEKLEQGMISVLESKSWKITEPLRKITTILKKN